jgi:hypothetical protein
MKSIDLAQGDAVRGAAELTLKELLSTNFLPNAVHRPAACIRSTFEAAQRHQFPIERIIFDVTEGDRARGASDDTYLLP